MNRYVARLLGEKTDIRGPRDISIPYRLFGHKHELPFWEQPLQRAVFTGQAVPAVEGRLVRSDGKSLDVLMSADCLMNGASHVVQSQPLLGRPKQVRTCYCTFGVR